MIKLFVLLVLTYVTFPRKANDSLCEHKKCVSSALLKKKSMSEYLMACIQTHRLVCKTDTGREMSKLCSSDYSICQNKYVCDDTT